METKYLRFIDCTPPESKTEKWEIFSKSTGIFLAEIKWFGMWRQYCFYPALVLFNSTCLDDIKKFLDKLNAEHKAKK